MALAVVRSLGAPRKLSTTQELEDFEQELVDQYLLASVGAGIGDSSVNQDRSVVFEFRRFLGRPAWAARPDDADRFLAHQRKDLGRARLTVQQKAWAIGHFYEFLIGRYQGDIQALTGFVVEQPIDEHNRPSKADVDVAPVPPSDEEVAALFDAWRDSLADARKFLPAARDYLAASLWRRAGLRIQETYMLDVRDWRRDLGDYGKVHVRFGKGSRGRGPKTAAGAGDQLGSGTAGLVDGGRAAPVRRRLAASGCAVAAERAERLAHRLLPPSLRPVAARRVDGRHRAMVAVVERAAAAACTAPLLRVVAVCAGHGSEGDPGDPRPLVAVHYHPIHPCP